MTYKTFYLLLFTFYLLLFTFYLLPFSLSSQKVEVLEKGETANLKKQPKIDYLFSEPEDDDRIYFVATLRAVGNKDIAQLFNVIRKEAGKMGANCFRLEEFIPGENISSLTLTIYINKTR